MAPAEAVRIAEWALEQGFTAMKVKVGIDPKEDIARVKALREFLGPDFRLGVDANGAWRPATAIKMIRAFEPYTPLFAEQPVPPGDVEWLKQVRAAVNVPVLADESVYTPLDAMALARAGAVDALSSYVGKAGGISGARKVAMIAEAAGMACTVGSNLELGVGSAAMIHMALATSGVTAEEFPCDIIGPFYYGTDLLREPLRLGGGRAYAPAGPGLGVELDDEMVARYLVK